MLEVYHHQSSIDLDLMTIHPTNEFVYGHVDGLAFDIP